MKSYNLSEKCRKNLLATTIAISVVGMVFFRVFVWAAIERSRQLTQSQLTRQRKVEALAGSLKTLKAELQKKEQRLSPTKQSLWLVNEISRLAEECHLKIIQAVPADAKEKGDYYKISLRVEMKGDYHSVGEFCQKAEEGEKLILISNLSLDPVAQTPAANPLLKVGMTLSIFFPKADEGNS